MDGRTRDLSQSWWGEMEAKYSKKNVDELHYAILDLKATIDVQEQSERQCPGSCPKLGQYWDELHTAIGERRRRQEKVTV